MRYPLACLLACLLLAPASRALAEEVPIAPPPPATLEEIAKRLETLNKRIDALVEVAKRDPDERKIDMYMKYGPKELKSTRGRYRAEELVEWMVDATKNFNVREKAQKALQEARLRGDPDLSDTEKRGSRTRRADFAYRELVKHLRDDDRASRQLVHDLLLTYYPRAKNQHPELRDFNSADEKTWKPAQNAWRRFLNRR